jgi:sec-independent protein translocase protein TatC
MSAEMTMSEHINESRSRTNRIVISIMVLTFFSMTFGSKPLQVNIGQLLLYYPFTEDFITLRFNLPLTWKDVTATGVKLIQTSPGQALFAQVYVSVLIGIIGSMPIIVKEIFAFFHLQLGKQTKTIGMVNVFLPTICMFILGIIFSYVVVIPFTLGFLYKSGQAMSV